MQYSVHLDNNLVKEYHQSMIDRLCNALSNMLDQADDVLFKLSISDQNNKEHSDYFLAMREIRLNREVVEEEFRNKLNENLMSRYSEEDSNKNCSLADDIDIEESIAINYSVRRTNVKCAYSLHILDKKIKKILENDKKYMGHNNVILTPEDICNLFANVSCKFGASTAVRLILYKLFEKTVAFNLDKIYTSIGDQIEFLCHEDDMDNTQENTGFKNISKLKIDKVADFSSSEEEGALDQDKNFYLKATSVIRNEISNHIHDCNIPEFIRLFLLEHWSKLLMKIYVRDGQKSNAWTHAVEVIDDIISLIENPHLLNDDKYLFNLKQRLIFGMNIIPLSAVKRDDFMQDLTNYFKKNSIDENKILNGNHNAPELIYNKDKKTKDISEDVTMPNPNIQAYVSGNNTPFMSELLVDLKK